MPPHAAGLRRTLGDLDGREPVRRRPSLRYAAGGVETKMSRPGARTHRIDWRQRTETIGGRPAPWDAAPGSGYRPATMNVASRRFTQPVRLCLVALLTASLFVASAWLGGVGGGATVVDAAGDPVLVGAGDIATCRGIGDSATAALVRAIPGTVFTAGDNAYESGTAAEYSTCYGPTWGAFRARTRPAPGNHEYNTAGASGYFAFFGARAGDPRRGYYAYDLGTWRVYVLNSNCAPVGGCGVGSPQERWLHADLARNPQRCTLAYWHHPLFSSGLHGNQASVRAFWDDLQAAGAELVINGHDHDYERFAPQTPAGVASPTGIREFVVGTGGRSRYPFLAARPNSAVRDASAYGVLKLTLHATGYDWRFVPEAGRSFTDSGSGTCR
jgi:hypothetical protein